MIDLLFLVIGSALVGISVSVFTVPNDIAPGGVSGLATALAHITPIRVSVWAFALNVPLLLGAYRSFGLRSTVLTLISTALLSLFIELWDSILPHYTHDPVIAAVFGGALCGAGVACLFLRGLSTGGSDLLALLLRKPFPNVPSGTMLLLIDGAIVLFAVAVFRDINVALYSAVTIYISSKVIDAVSQGVDYAKVIFVITDRGAEINEKILRDVDRGTTLLNATGGYTGSDKLMLITVTRRNVLTQTLGIIRKVDPKAFTFVMNATEVHGEGFRLDAEES